MKTWATKNGTKITRVLAGRSNVFLVAHGGNNILVDTSPGSRWRRLDGKLEDLGVERLKALVLTHSHYDHAGNAARLQRLYGIPVIMHRAEAPLLATGESIVPDGTFFPSRFLVAHLGKRFSRRIVYDPCRADILVDDGLRLDDFGFNAWILHTPGHSPGSISLIVDDEIAIVGDAMFGVFPWSVMPPFAVDAGAMVASWGKLLQTKCRLFLPAHGSANSREQVVSDYNKRGTHDHEKNE